MHDEFERITMKHIRNRKGEIIKPYPYVDRGEGAILKMSEPELPPKRSVSPKGLAAFGICAFIFTLVFASIIYVAVPGGQSAATPMAHEKVIYNYSQPIKFKGEYAQRQYDQKLFHTGIGYIHTEMIMQAIQKRLHDRMYERVYTPQPQTQYKIIWG
ncbi:MAG: hypothetical protein FWE16_00195 [Firmicutes bacterium]|nr:hypothetical protein [Bacillota bacterium]